MHLAGNNSLNHYSIVMKISSKIHGIIDYAVVAFLWASPMLFHLPEMTSLFIYLLGVVHLLLTISTNFELGVFKLVPLKIHGWIELIVSVALVGIAFYLGSLEGNLARNYCLGFGIAVFATWAITDYSHKKA